jgi:tetratricopeptide (TPR) repeat protein
MKFSTKIILAVLGTAALGAATVITLGVVFFWQLAEGTKLSSLGYENMLQNDYDGAIKNLTDASNKIVIGNNRFWLYVNRGAAEFHKKRYDDAIKDFTTAIEIDPSQADPYERRGQAYEQKEEIDKALADYDRALERDPNRGQPHLQRGTILYDRDEFDKALGDFQEVVRIWPNYAHGFLMRGRCLLKQNDLDHALANFDAAIAIQPWNMQAHEERAKTYRQLGNSERAFFDTAEAQHLAGPPRSLTRPSPSPFPDKFGLGGTLGVAPLPRLAPKDQGSVSREYSGIMKEMQKQSATGDYDKAIELCNKALALDLNLTRRSIATLERGSLLWQKGEYEKADADYEEAIKINPRNAMAYVYRGNSLDDRGESDDALKDYEEAIRINPREYFAYCHRGLAFFRQGEFENALTDFAKAIELNPTRPDAYLCRAYLSVHRKDYPGAIADCATGLEYHPDWISLYTLRSMAYLRSGKFDQAEQDLRTAKALAKRDERHCHDALAWFRSTCPEAGRRNGAEALVEAKHSCEMVHWKRWGPLDTLAAAEAEAGDFRKAIEYEERALQMPVPPALRPEVEARLALFRQHQPFRETGAN